MTKIFGSCDTARAVGELEDSREWVCMYHFHGASGNNMVPCPVSFLGAVCSVRSCVWVGELTIMNGFSLLLIGALLVDNEVDCLSLE